MRVIIGYGNELRGEDAFGVDTIKELQKLNLKNTKLLSMHQLTPEIVLKLLDADEIIFIDASYDEKNHYALACSLTEQNNLNLSHHISPKTIIHILKSLYKNVPSFFVYSMISKSFEKIEDQKRYKKCIDMLVKNLAPKEDKVILE
ncbi:MAG: hydrogenase maturation protease [Sulfurimonas sp.]|uniref:hydrogenase maturation protease n=1 Tax=Sulfurimonas sp. TaxID=2022749 RepID=UPI0025D59D7C|nr:hydrogenase maturation protease [Sulfurimonas sp.]MCK9491455.1 hydrogenase maturation protease [Sulfurimonas sp.]